MKELQELFDIIEGTNSKVCFIDELSKDILIDEEYYLGPYKVTVSFFNNDDAIFYITY